jgi:hypothetical protein
MRISAIWNAFHTLAFCPKDIKEKKGGKDWSGGS